MIHEITHSIHTLNNNPSLNSQFIPMSFSFRQNHFSTQPLNCNRSCVSTISRVGTSQLRDIFFQIWECIENLWLFFAFKIRKDKKKFKDQKIESVLREKNLARRYIRELKSEIFMFKIKSETWNFKGNYRSPFLSVNSFQPFASELLSTLAK